MEEASVALYWDFENIHASAMTIAYGKDWFQRYRDKKIRMEDTKVLDVGAVMQYASTLGEVVINKAYANWTNFWPYTEPLNEYSMDLVQLFPLGGSVHAKNGADIRLSLDIAEDLVLHPHLDIVVLVSGDSDFISIAQRVRRKHKRIVGLGVKETSNRYWQMACNEFKLYRTIVKQYGSKSTEEDDADDVVNEGDEVAYALAEPPKGAAGGAKSAGQPAEGGKSASAKTRRVPVPAAAKPKRVSAEKRLLRRAIAAMESREGSPWIKRVKIKPMMLRLDPAFDEANYGFSNFTAFLEGCSDVVDLREADDDVLVRVRRKGRAQGGAAAAPKRKAPAGGAAKRAGKKEG